MKHTLVYEQSLQLIVGKSEVNHNHIMQLVPLPLCRVLQREPSGKLDKQALSVIFTC